MTNTTKKNKNIQSRSNKAWKSQLSDPETNDNSSKYNPKTQSNPKISMENFNLKTNKTSLKISCRTDKRQMSSYINRKTERQKVNK